MHLQNHLRTDTLAAEALVDAHHRYLYDVGGRALYRCVDGVALGEVAHGGVVRSDVGQVAAAVEERLGVAMVARQLLRLLHVLVYAGERAEVAVDELLRLVARDVETLGESEDGDAVDDAEVGALSLGALVARHGFYILFIYARCGGGVYVVSLAERLNHVLVAGEVSHDAKLNLRVVGREEELARFGDEALSNLLAVLAAHGDVLQVGVGRGEAARCRYSLIERGVDMSGAWVDELGQRVDISAEQLLQSAMLKDMVDDGRLGAQLLQHLLGCYVLTGLGLLRFLHYLHLAEQHFAHLLRRGDVELVTGELVDALLYLLHALGEHLRCLGERTGVETHAVHLHLGENRHKRHLDVVEQLLDVGFLESRLQHVVQTQRHVGILSSIVADSARRKVAHVALRLSLRTNQFVDMNRLIVE